MRKIQAIEGLRGVLALWVVFGHTLAASGLGEHWKGPFKVLAAGGNAVDAFIIISGFVIFYLLDTAQESYGRFILRRALRLYPVYLVCLLISAVMLPLVLQAYSHAPWPHPLNASRVQIAEHGLAFLPQQFLAHLTMMHALIPDYVLPSANYAILGQAWSLSLEWQFYIVAPLLFWALVRGGRYAIAVIGIACLAHFTLNGGEGFLPRHLPMFAVGIVSYATWRYGGRISWPLMMPAGVALAYLLTYTPGVVIWAAVFLAAYSPESIGSQLVRGVLESRLLLALGRWSYSLYLSHAAVMTAVMLGLERVGFAAVGQWAFFAALFAATAGLSIAVSAALYALVEAPCIKLGRQIGRKMPAGQAQAMVQSQIHS